MRKWKNIIPVVGRASVEGVSTPSLSLETLISVPFAILTKLAKQIETLVRK
jgi:hypothetical protein